MNLLDDTTVAIAAGFEGYPSDPPFHPDADYPECPLRDAAAIEGKRAAVTGKNAAYAAVREALRLLDLDASRFGTAAWNPLGGVVHPGDAVVLKPNFVREFRETQPGHANCLITHGSILRAVVDYVYLALGGTGRIVIADASHSDADFHAVCEISGLDTLQQLYRDALGFELEVYDLRPERARKIDGVIVGHDALPGDPAGYVTVNLGARSAFMEVNRLDSMLYGSEYHVEELHQHHHDDVHEYLISKTVLEADCVLSLPKLKTHKKVGITINMKNLVGINGNKNWLPHHREGTPAQGGDQFPDNGVKHRLERRVVGQFRRLFPLLGPFRSIVARPIKAAGTWFFGDTNTDTIRSGNWHGNDTTWRMVHDLNRILLYADAEGGWHDRPVRRFFSFVDGIVGGEGNGPLDPTPKASGVVLAGANAVAVDLACARLMGLDFHRMPILTRVFADHPFPLVRFEPGDVVGRSGDSRYSGRVDEMDGSVFGFLPHFGWRRHLELLPAESASG